MMSEMTAPMMIARVPLRSGYSQMGWCASADRGLDLPGLPVAMRSGN
jgi:hypothetical protein